MHIKSLVRFADGANKMRLFLNVHLLKWSSHYILDSFCWRCKQNATRNVHLFF